MRIAVTGATGFVGTALLRAAALAGHETIALTRGAGPQPAAGRVARIAGLEDAAGLQAGLAGADAVVHLAARVHIMREESPDSPALFRRVNVDGTQAVIAAAMASGVRRFVLLSTAKVHGEGRDAPYRETDELAPVGSYSVSKAEAEACVAAVAPSTLAWTILRSPLVYGPGVGGNFRRLLQLAHVASRVPLPLGGIENRRSLVSVSNLASGILAVVTGASATGRRYLVSDGTDVSTSDLLRALGTALGAPARLFTVPSSTVRLALKIVGRSAEADRLFESFAVDASALRAELGWRPPQQMAAALAETASWWRAEERR